MRKRIKAVVAVCIALLILTGCSGGDSSGTGTWPAMDSLKAVDADDITSISYTRSTEAGVTSDTIRDAAEIEEVYQLICGVEILSEAEESVVDDGLDIIVETPDGEITFSFAGDIVMLDGAINYEVDNIDSLRNYLDNR